MPNPTPYRTYEECRIYQHRCRNGDYYAWGTSPIVDLDLPHSEEFLSYVVYPVPTCFEGFPHVHK